MLLHAVDDDAVVLRRVTIVVQVVGVRTAPILPVPQVHSNELLIELHIVELEEKELVRDNSLRREYGEVCVSDEEGGGDCGSSVGDTHIDLTSHIGCRS